MPYSNNIDEAACDDKRYFTKIIKSDFDEVHLLGASTKKNDNADINSFSK